MTATLHRHFLAGRSDTTVCGAKQYGTRDPERVTCPKCLPSARAILHTNALEPELVAAIAVGEGLRALGGALPARGHVPVTGHE